MTCKNSATVSRDIVIDQNPFEGFSSALRIGYQNALQQGTGVDSAVTSWRPWELSSVTAGDAVTLSQPQTMGYFGVIHGPSGLKLEYNDGVEWKQAGIDSTGGEVSLCTFPSIRANEWRVVFPADADVAVVAAGPLMHWQPQESGFTPPELAQDVEYLNNVSQTGNFLGRVVKYRQSDFKISLNAVPEDYVYQFIDAFLLHADTFPFFLNWSRDAAAFCWTTGKRAQPSYSDEQNMSMDLRLRGWVA